MGTEDARSLERSLPRHAYVDARFFEREVERIFLDQWVYAGRLESHEPFLRQPGDYRVVTLADESIILIRGDDGAIHAHLNFCRHRGSRLLTGDGNVRGSIRCPYHAWAYAPSGELIASPFVDRDALPECERRLHPVAVAEWGGFLFLNASPAPDSLAEHLGPIPERLRRYPLAELRSARTLHYTVAANWKVILENYNECYHCAGVHPELCKIVPAFRNKGGSDLDWERGIPHREGATTFTFSGTTSRAAFPTLNDDERVRHKGELIYPNFMLSLSADHVAAFELRPEAPDRTHITCEFLFDPHEIATPGFDPSDAVDFWDLVNRQDWTICESVQAGMHSRRFQKGYYAPMEDSSLDIRRYIAERLGSAAIEDAR